MMMLGLAAPLVLLGAPAAAPEPEPPPTPQEAPTQQAAQAAPHRRGASNSIFAEVLGSGLLYSVNYERILDALPIGLRAGVSYFTVAVSSYGRSGNLVLMSFPLVASYYVPFRNHNLQLGLGTTILYTGVATDSQGTEFASERSGLGLAASGVVGYRYLPRDGGFTFGAAFTPLVRASSFLPWAGATLGYAF